MKYAIISDIHGNIIALKKALELIEKEQVEKIICLGDIIGIGTRSDDCVKQLINLKDKLICVRGNHEDRFLFGVPDYIHDGLHKMTDEDKAQEYWIRDHISAESKSFLEKLPQESIVTLEGFKVAITHYPSKEDMSYCGYIYYPVTDELLELFKKYDSRINLYGHTHVSRVKFTENRLFVNPGTLGTTDYKDYGTYGILTIDGEDISYVEKSFNYDLKSVLDDFDVMNPPRKDHMRDKFFGYKR